jgi:hypothetical protein
MMHLSIDPIDFRATQAQTGDFFTPKVNRVGKGFRRYLRADCGHSQV